MQWFFFLLKKNARHSYEIFKYSVRNFKGSHFVIVPGDDKLQGRQSGITSGGLEIKIQHFVCFSGKFHKCFKT